MVYNYHIGIEDSTMKNKKQAFTLAEVLLVLAIIGVIAAVTIPAVMQQSSEKKFIALAKKAMSTVQNAMDLKLATVPIGPGDMHVGFLQWLIDGEEDGTNTLKVIKRNNDTDTTVAQMPDGMIYWLQEGAGCTSPSTRTDKIGCHAILFIDLNGADPPTKTTVENASTLLWEARSKATAYDTIAIFIHTNTRIASRNITGAIKDRSIKYLGILAN